jgi:hypothetical protein
MPVIGRLDRQVNEVLIEPLDRNRPRDARDAPAAPGDAMPVATNTGAPRDEDRRRDDERLPVWLL